MPRKMMGPGSAKMGGGGKKPPPLPATPFGGPAQGAAPGGTMIGAAPTRGGPRRMPSSAGGFNKGGSTEDVKKHEQGGSVERLGKRERAYAKGGAVHDDEAADKKLFGKMMKQHEVSKHAHGGPVLAGHSTHGLRGTPHPAGQGISRGSDTKRSSGPKGSDSRTHRPHSGKAS